MKIWISYLGTNKNGSNVGYTVFNEVGYPPSLREMNVMVDKVKDSTEMENVVVIGAIPLRDEEGD